MTDKEKENYKSILKDINQKMPMGEDCYDYRGAVVAHRTPTKAECAIADIAGILYEILDMLGSDTERSNHEAD